MQALGAANLAFIGRQAYDTATSPASGASAGDVGFKVSVNSLHHTAGHALRGVAYIVRPEQFGFQTVAA